LTAEIVIVNRYGVALATDSAITLAGAGTYRTFASGNKLFALAPHIAVGVMFYGSPSFSDVPWEAVVKTYRQRREIGPELPTLRDYAEDFVSFLSEEAVVPSTLGQDSAMRMVATYYEEILRQINHLVRTHILAKGHVPVSFIDELAIRVVTSHLQEWQAGGEHAQLCPYATELRSVIDEKFRKQLQELQQEIFEHHTVLLEEGDLTELAKMLVTQHLAGFDPVGCSGIVIAGFGAQDMFPAVMAYHVWGRLGRILMCAPDPLNSHAVAGPDDAFVIPFAQPGGLERLLGCDPQTRTFLGELVLKVQGKPVWDDADAPPPPVADHGPLGPRADARLLDPAVVDLVDAGTIRLRELFHEPILRTVACMPKEELVEMAGLCVALASFLKTVSLEDGPNSVVGPVDVAVISKGDGFIWIKRKHYFDSSLNPRFLQSRHGSKDVLRTERGRTTELRGGSDADRAA
jgi:hypothetical protein